MVSINCLDENGLSPIDQAAFKGNEELVEWLLANKANPHNKANKDGYTSLMFAALSGMFKCAVKIKKLYYFCKLYR